jgi:AraC-like DNA-binding protein
MLAAAAGADETVPDHIDATLPERVYAFVEQNYVHRISLRDVAEAVGYSACHLTTTFRQVTGTPVTAWIIKRRITAAQELLEHGNINVASACEAVGFMDLSYFSRQFVRHVGVTPGRFRAATRQPAGASTGRASRRSEPELDEARVAIGPAVADIPMEQPFIFADR